MEDSPSNEDEVNISAEDEEEDSPIETEEENDSLFSIHLARILNAPSRSAIDEMVFPPSLMNSRPTRRFIPRIQRPPRLIRQFRVNYHSQPVSEDEDELPDPDPASAENFDTDLPAEHSYLGSNMSRVSGVNYLEAGKLYKMLLFSHKSLLFPGETLPMIIPNYMFDTTLDEDADGIQFGLMFPSTGSDNQLYGVTCQIYEKGNDQIGNVLLKSKAHHRFVLQRKDNPKFDEMLPENKTYAYIRILPEIYLPDPLSCIPLGSLSRFRGIPSMENSLKKFQASTTGFPSFVFESYNISTIIEKAKVCLESYKMNSMPTDPVLLSFWLGRNLLHNIKDRYKLFLTNCVNTRLQIIDKSLDNEKFFCCTRCESKIANCSSLFAMSKHGVQTNYINPNGCIHETNTVYNLVKDSSYPTGQPSEEFSWFPGYSWQIILCRRCDMHLGWKFASTNPNLLPKMFYGLSGTSLKVFTKAETERYFVYGSQI